MSKAPMVTAHMGDCEHFPQNTLAAFESAIAKGADAIEIDVHESRDEWLVVIMIFISSVAAPAKDLLEITRPVN